MRIVNLSSHHNGVATTQTQHTAWAVSTASSLCRPVLTKHKHLNPKRYSRNHHPKSQVSDGLELKSSSINKQVNSHFDKGTKGEAKYKLLQSYDLGLLDCPQDDELKEELSFASLFATSSFENESIYVSAPSVQNTPNTMAQALNVAHLNYLQEQHASSSKNQDGASLRQEVSCTSHKQEPSGLRILLYSLGLISAAAIYSLYGISNSYAAPIVFPEIANKFNATVELLPDEELNITSEPGKNNALLIWKSFNLSRGYSVYFTNGSQGNQDVSFLNVVKGPGRSNIYGYINGDNRSNFYLINPNGIHLGKTSRIQGFNQVYLGTHKVSPKLLEKFKDGTAPAITLGDLPNTKGMGKVSLLGDIDAKHIKVNGSQIVIRDAQRLNSTNKLQSMELHSSTGRIDVGGRVTDKDEFERITGLTGISSDKTKANGSHEQDQYVTHFGQTAIYNNIANPEHVYAGNNLVNRLPQDRDGEYWLADDIVLDYKDSQALREQAFTGKLDGAFHTIKLTGTIDDNAQAEQNHGLFGKLDGAKINDLKLMSDELKVDPKLQGHKVSLGAVAGTIKDSSLRNVEVVDLAVDVGSVKLSQDSSIGALAGKLEGTNELSNVISSFDAKTHDALAAQKQANQLQQVGTLAGSNTGTIKSSMLIAGINTGKQALAAVGADNSGINIATSYNQAYQNALQTLKAQGKSEQEAKQLLSEVFVSATDKQGTVTAMKHKGFLKPFFIEDYSFTYDGTSHNYKDLVNNEGFDLENSITKLNPKLDYSQKNAGQYGYQFTTREENKDLGHDFYFDYQYAGDTWQGDGKAQRSDREASLDGVGTLNINKKTINITIADQTIEHDGTPNLTVDKTTIKDWDKLQQSLIPGDKLTDLNIVLNVKGDKLTAQSNSDNYELIVTDGTLTLKPAPVPPAPPVDPQPQPQPQPDPQPVPPLPQPAPLPEVMPKPTPQVSLDLGAQSKCQNCTNYESSRFLPFAWLVDHSVMSLAGLDFSQAMFAALDMGIEPHKLGANLPMAPARQPTVERLADAQDNSLQNLAMSTASDLEESLIENTTLGLEPTLALAHQSPQATMLATLQSHKDKPLDDNSASEQLSLADSLIEPEKAKDKSAKSKAPTELLTQVQDKQKVRS